MQIGLIYHAKMALKERLNTKGQQLAPNGKEPFNKVEEGLKIGTLQFKSSHENNHK
mgnify:CR=1 FL=1